MAARKSFLKSAPSDEQFDRLLAEAAQAGITEDQLKEQRVSFAYGNAPADSKNSKASVRDASKHNLLVPA